jgi:imidazolonepropionase
MIRADLLVTNIGDLATLARGSIPRVSESMRDLGLMHDAALAVTDGRFSFLGPQRRARAEVRLRSGGIHWDADGGVVVPGFVDAHTHLLFAGDRSAEIELKLAGATYVEIARRGGGLFSTVRATRRAPASDLLRLAEARLHRLAHAGTTSVEVKSGYALNHAGELRLLALIPRLARRTGMRLVPTYLGAHAVPPEFVGRADAYVDQMVRKTLPVVARRRLAKFCDVFCEPGFFTTRQSERLLRAAAGLGLGIKIHAEEFVLSGGARVAARLGARSADHLLAARAGDRIALARAGVTAVLLPVTPFASLSPHRVPGRELVDAGVPVALGSDLSPNSWVESMPVVLSHAIYGGRISPAEALTAATVNAAHATGLEDVAGQISVGRSADFSIFDLPGVAHLGYRVGVFPTHISRQGIAISLR